MEEKDLNSCFDITMGSYDGEEFCEFIGMQILS